MCSSRWIEWTVRALLMGASAVACASPQGQGSRGDTCFRIEDCREGLVCIENQCSRDLSRIGSDYDPAPGPGAPQEPAPPADAAPSSDGDVEPPVPGDAGGPGPDPVDSGPVPPQPDGAPA